MPVTKNMKASTKDTVNDSELLFGIDDEVMFGDDEAFDLARSIYDEVLASKRSDDDAIFAFIEYLDLIVARAKGFGYKVFSEENRIKHKILGILWMTATMRRNFELFGSSICIHMMKRGLNTLLWPYTAGTMLDKMNHAYVLLVKA